MNQEIREALNDFFSGQKRLSQQGIIHSPNYIGDISRYLCTVLYDLKLIPDPKERQEAGYDGKIGSSKVLVKPMNCPRGHKVILEESFEFDELIVVLGPSCSLKPTDLKADFIFYRFTKEDAVEKFRTPEGKYVGGKELFSQGHDKILNLT